MTRPAIAALSRTGGSFDLTSSSSHRARASALHPDDPRATNAAAAMVRSVAGEPVSLSRSQSVLDRSQRLRSSDSGSCSPSQRRIALGEAAIGSCPVSSSNRLPRTPDPSSAAWPRARASVARMAGRTGAPASSTRYRPSLWPLTPTPITVTPGTRRVHRGTHRGCRPGPRTLELTLGPERMRVLRSRGVDRHAQLATLQVEDDRLRARLADVDAQQCVRHPHNHRSPAVSNVGEHGTHRPIRRPRADRGGGQAEGWTR